MKLFALETNQFAYPRELWSFRFNFEANDDSEADRLAFKWAEYQGIDPRDVRCSPTKFPQIAPSNEYVR